MAESSRTKMRFQWRTHKLIWNMSGGRLGRTVAGMPVVELVTVGRRSGQERQVLITYIDDPGGPILVGTNAGRDSDPAWVSNLRAKPEARARWDGAWREVRAVELQGADHDDAWKRAVAANPGYADYAEDLTRPIPIVQLEALI